LEDKIKAKMLIVIMTALAFLSCSQVYLKGYDPRGENFLSSVGKLSRTPEEKIEADSLQRNFRIFQIVSEADPDTVYKKLVEKMEKLNVLNDLERDSLYKLMEKFKIFKDLDTHLETPDTNEWWGTMLSRANICDQNYRDPYFGRRWSMIGKYIMLLGEPEIINEKEENDCFYKKKHTSLPCKSWYAEWTKLEIYLAFQDEDYDGKPDIEIPHPNLMTAGVTKKDATFRQSDMNKKLMKQKEYYPFPEVEKVLIANLNITSFPENDNRYTVWLSAGVPLKQLKSDDSLINLHVETVIYNQEGSPIVLDNGLNCHILQLLEFNWWPIYRDYNLPSGKFTLAFTLKGRSEKEMGIYKYEFSLPSPNTREMSDILIALLPPRNDDSTVNRIVRKGNIALMGNPYETPVFAPGDTIFPYAEASLKNFQKIQGQYTYLITWSLLGPIEEKEKIPEVKTGPLMVIKKPGSVFVEDEKYSVKGTKARLILSSGEKTGLKEEIFVSPLYIPSDISPGIHYLRISVDDKNISKRSHHLEALKKIVIKPK
jgi:hypothetical protein